MNLRSVTFLVIFKTTALLSFLMFIVSSSFLHCGLDMTCHLVALTVHTEELLRTAVRLMSHWVSRQPYQHGTNLSWTSQWNCSHLELSLLGPQTPSYIEAGTCRATFFTTEIAKIHVCLHCRAVLEAGTLTPLVWSSPSSVWFFRCSLWVWFWSHSMKVWHSTASDMAFTAKAVSRKALFFFFKSAIHHMI